MQSFKHADMTNGWFVGDFTPTVLATRAVEVAVKHFPAGAVEARHYHKIAQEITLIQSGLVCMNGTQFGAGDIVVIEPLESCDFAALEASTLVVVKLPGAVNDKYLGEPPC